MLYYLDLYATYLRLTVKMWSQYRADFLISIISLLLLNSTRFIFLTVIFSNLKQLEGWSFHDLLLMWGLSALSGSLANGFLDVPHRINFYILQGDLDRVLVRPLDPLFQIAGESGISLQALGGVFVGIAALATAFNGLGETLPWWSLLYLPVSIISGILILFSVQLIMACLGFWFTNTVSFLQTMSWLNQFGQYPITIFAPPLQFFFSWILPYSMVGFYPAAFLVRGGEYQMYGWIVPLMGLSLWGLSIFIWHISVQQYQGTGS